HLQEVAVLVFARYIGVGDSDNRPAGDGLVLDLVDGRRAGRRAQVGRVGARVAGVALAVHVAVGLVHVRHRRAVVHRVGDAVTVGVVGVHRRAHGGVGVERTGVARVAHAVGV